MSMPSVTTRFELARTLATEGEWGSVRELLLPTPLEGRDPELILLLAEASLRTGYLADGRALLEPLVTILAQQGNTPARRRAVNMLGASAFELGLMGPAEERFQEALALGNSAEDLLSVGRATNNLGMIAHIRGAYDKALSFYQLAVPAYQRLGASAGLAETHHNMALALRELGRLELADKQERRAIGYAREAGNRRLLAMAQVGRAELSLRRGEAAIAEAGARLGAEEYATIPDHLGEADALRIAGAARTALGALSAAREVLDRAVALAQEHGSALIEAESREARARLSAASQDWPAVKCDAEVALALLDLLGASDGRAALAKWYREVVPA
jgi:tetratricopeptide (TPR) repeat protein